MGLVGRLASSPPADYKSALPAPAEGNSALRFPLYFPSPFLPADYKSALPCRFQALCLIEETPMQASPAKYNLALPGRSQGV